MRPLLLLPALLALGFAPLAAHAAPVREEEVQEPESDDTATQDTQAPDAQTPNAYMPEPDQPIGDEASPANPATPVNVPPVAVTQTPPVNPAAPAPPPSGDMNYDMAMLQGLNKVTARAQPLEAAIGSVVRYGTLEIIAHKCWKADPGERPENAALLEISEIKQGEAPQRIFSGWMFSSTPGLSALEHPFYDINVISCSKGEAKP